jgi:hypothetical protein
MRGSYRRYTVDNQTAARLRLCSRFLFFLLPPSSVSPHLALTQPPPPLSPVLPDPGSMMMEEGGNILTIIIKKRPRGREGGPHLGGPGRAPPARVTDRPCLRDLVDPRRVEANR